MTEAITGIEADKKDNTDKYGIVAQYAQRVQEQSVAGSVNFSVKPSCESVSNTVKDSKAPTSLETATEPNSGRFDAISSTNSKREASAVDSKQYFGPDGKIHKDNVDKSMKTDADGDGLVDGIDKKNQTRGEVAAEKAREKSIENARKNSFKKRASAASISKVSSITSDQDAKNSGILGQSKKKGPGEFDFSALDPDKENNNKIGKIEGAQSS
jgi:hypothetical protein